MKCQSFVNFPKKIKEIIKMFSYFWCLLVVLILLLFGLHFLRGLMFKHVHFRKHIWIIRQKWKKKCLHNFFSSPDEISSLPVFLTGMISTQDEISSRQKRVNSKRHLPYIGMISFRHEISLNCFINSLKCFVYIVFA